MLATLGTSTRPVHETSQCIINTGRQEYHTRLQIESVM